MISFFPLNKAESILNNPEGKRITKLSNIELVHLSLKQNEIIPIHENPFDVIFHIKSGEGELLLENKKEKISKDDTIFIQYFEKRGIENTHSVPLEILVIKIFKD